MAMGVFMNYVSCRTSGKETSKLWKYIHKNQLDYSFENYYESTLFTIGVTDEDQKAISKITPVYELDY